MCRSLRGVDYREGVGGAIRYAWQYDYFMEWGMMEGTH